jgi:hypothetical protein
MNGYLKASCWAAVSLVVAVAGMFDIIDQASMTTLLVALPIAGWMAVSGRGCCLTQRRA